MATAGGLNDTTVHGTSQSIFGIGQDFVEPASNPGSSAAVSADHRRLLGPARRPRRQQPQGALPPQGRTGTGDGLPQAPRCGPALGLLPRRPAHLRRDAGLGSVAHAV